MRVTTCDRCDAPLGRRPALEMDIEYEDSRRHIDLCAPCLADMITWVGNKIPTKEQ